MTSRKLFDNVDSIMNALVTVASITLRKTENDKGMGFAPTQKETVSLLEQHRQLLKAQDLVYVGLRKIYPTKEERKQTRRALELMEHLWMSMEFSKTHKVHLLFDHAADEQEKRWGGLGDKIEDPLEKRHQQQVQLYNALKRIPDRKKQLQIQSRREWTLSDPNSLEILENIHGKTQSKQTISTPRKRRTNECVGNVNMFGVLKEVKRIKKEEIQSRNRRSVSALKRWDGGKPKAKGEGVKKGGEMVDE